MIDAGSIAQMRRSDDHRAERILCGNVGQIALISIRRHGQWRNRQLTGALDDEFR
jgi:hypothetical protein